MVVRPQRVELKHILGQKTPTRKMAVNLTVPRTAGRRWVATPNAQWLRCTAPHGAARDTPQSVAFECLGESLPVKCHRAAVVFRTDLGVNCTVMVHAKVYPASPFSLIVEAEHGEITHAMEKVADKAASGGVFVHSPEPPTRPDTKSKSESGGTVTFTFDAPSDGTYYVLGRCLAPEPSGAHNSFLFSMDGAEFEPWEAHAQSKAYCWALLNLRDLESPKPRVKDPFPFQLAKGRHSLVIQALEPRTRLDCIAITNYPYPPE